MPCSSADSLRQRHNRRLGEGSLRRCRQDATWLSATCQMGRLSCRLHPGCKRTPEVRSGPRSTGSPRYSRLMKHHNARFSGLSAPLADRYRLLVAAPAVQGSGCRGGRMSQPGSGDGYVAEEHSMRIAEMRRGRRGHGRNGGPELHRSGAGTSSSRRRPGRRSSTPSGPASSTSADRTVGLPDLRRPRDPTVGRKLAADASTAGFTSALTVHSGTSFLRSVPPCDIGSTRNVAWRAGGAPGVLDRPGVSRPRSAAAAAPPAPVR